MMCLECRVSAPETFKKEVTALRCFHPGAGSRHGRVTHLYKTGCERAYFFTPPAWCPENDNETEREHEGAHEAELLPPGLLGA